jgi:hypothetical protein
VVGALYWLRRDPRTWGPRLLHPVVNLVVLATAVLVFPRLILPAIGVVLLLAAAPVGVLLARRDVASRIGAVALAVLMLVEPMRASWRYVERVAKPSAEDEALDWVDAIAAPGSRILETRLAANPGATPGCALGIDRSRFVFIERTRPEDQPDLRLLVPEMDYVITGGGRRRDPADLVEPVFVPKGPGCGEALRIERPLAAAKPRYVPVDLARASVSASESAAHLPALVDDRGDTVWSTSGTAPPPEWIEIQLADGVQLGYLALESPEKTLAGGKLSVMVAERGRDFRPVRRIAELASSASRQLKRPNIAPPRPFERRFILRDRSLIHAVRIERRAARGESWGLDGLRLAALAADE